MGRAFEARKEKKLKRWSNISRLFTRYSREIYIAVKENGPNPEYNAKLRAIIQNARSDNMPKENIERAIKRASEKDATDYQEHIYEGYAPFGVAVLIICATDNHIRTVANLKSYFNKYGGNLAVSGSVSYLFEKKCVFIIQSDIQNLEDFELELIDYGAEEVFKNEDGIQIYGDFSSFGTLQKYLEEKKYHIVKADFDYIPMELKHLSPEQQATVEKLIDKIEEDDDVVRVFTNMA